MANPLNITLIQTEILWEQINKNLERIATIIQNMNQETDIIILPEMFTTGFSMNPQSCYDTMNGKTIKWMKELSRDCSSAICGSFIVKENDRYYNRLVFMQEDGNSISYDKRHLFSITGEDKYFSAGQKRVVIDHKGWKIMPLICYDLRFPVWSRNRNEYDLMIYIANWPDSRSQAWRSLLVARAIENQSYSIGVNRVGNDYNKTSYSGDSMVVDPTGTIISQMFPYKESYKRVTLSYEKIIEYKKKFPFLNDADKFSILR
jgi:omega-amidase